MELGSKMAPGGGLASKLWADEEGAVTESETEPETYGWSQSEITGAEGPEGGGVAQHVIHLYNKRK